MLVQEKFFSLGGYVDKIVLGSVLVLILGFFPQGLVGLVRQRWWPRLAAAATGGHHEQGAGIRRRGAAKTSRDEILQAAAELFMAYGYTATSIDAVAERLGATKGRIYHHWRSKADLYFDVQVARDDPGDRRAVEPLAKRQPGNARPAGWPPWRCATPASC